MQNLFDNILLILIVISGMIVIVAGMFLLMGLCGMPLPNLFIYRALII